ncbi:MAG: hypothetical protein K5622_06225 [Endomicrobiaceae bacterium]|nr:hypothetical protein [Endomicrobiaceae bacterium]
MNNRKGQVLPYMLVMSLILILSWAMLINIAKVLRDKMILQNYLDNTVLSVANLQARTLNILGATNNLMATVLSTASYPAIAMFPSFSTDKVGGSMIPGPFSDYYCPKAGLAVNEKYSGVLKMKKIVNTIQQFQDLLLTNYMVQSVLLTEKIPDKDYKVFVVPSRYAKGTNFTSFNITDPKVWLGIKRNTKGITYYKTQNWCIDFKAKHYHIVLPKQYMKDKVSWYVQDDNFYDKKLVAVGIKAPSKEEIYPLFEKVFNVDMPILYCLGSAGLYNTKGAMFPKKEDTSTGLSYIVAALLSPMIANQLYVLYNVIEAANAIPAIGQVCAAIGTAYAVYYAGETARKIVAEPLNKETPIYKYNEAELGGWDAHLVPL